MWDVRMNPILIALDSSKSSPAVLRGATEFAKQTGAAVILLHVIEPIASYVAVGASMDVITTSPPVIESEQTAPAEARLEELAGALRAAGLSVTCKCVIGIAADEILEEAGTSKASLIVLGSHGHGALYHLFSGSVVTGVLKRAACPVLVIPVGKS